MLVLFYTLFSCNKVHAVNIQSASLIRRDLILSNPTTVASIQDFSTLKLDLSSVSIILNRQTGQRTLHQDKSEFNKLSNNNIERDEVSSQTTEASSRTTRDASFAEVVDVTITIDDQDVDATSETMDQEFVTASTLSTSTNQSLISSTISTTATTTLDYSLSTINHSSSQSFNLSTTDLSSTTTPKSFSTISQIVNTSTKRPFRRIGFNRGSVESRPILPNGKSTSYKIPKMPETLLPAIAIIAEWITAYIKSKPKFSHRCFGSKAIKDSIYELIKENEINDAVEAGKKLAEAFLEYSNEKGKQTIKSNSEIDKIDALNMIDDSKDSVHGNDVRRKPGARLRYNIYHVFAKISPFNSSCS